MKPPRCRLCGKGHYGLCASLKATPEEIARSPGLIFSQVRSINVLKKRAAARKVLSPKKLGSVKPDVKLFKQGLTEMAGDVLKEINASLTPAQRQKAYRERGGDGLRERERLRMAAKRKEKSDG